LATSLKNAGQKNVFYGDVKSIIEDLKLKKEKGILLFVGAGNMQDSIKTHLNGLL
jgi:UDP-N-acetylmuramate-alanine ligase